MSRKCKHNVEHGTHKRRTDKEVNEKNVQECKQTSPNANKKTHKSFPLDASDLKRRAKNGCRDERYDIIIVGAGTAGGLLTYRLAKKYPNAKILVLDVGQDDVRIATGFPQDPSSVVPNPNPDPSAGIVPDNWGQLLRTILSVVGEGCAQWQQEIVTMPDDQFFRVPIQYALGATLGGTSAINAQLWNRGTKEGTYERWVEATEMKLLDLNQW